MKKIPAIFDRIFAFWPSDVAMAADMGVTRRCARHWICRGYVPTAYWPSLTHVCAEKFNKRLSHKKLVDALLAKKVAEPRKVRELQLYTGPHYPWTSTLDAELTALVADGATLGEAAHRLRRSCASVHRRRRWLGLPCFARHQAEAA